MSRGTGQVGYVIERTSVTAQRITERRVALNLTQTELSAALGLGAANVAHWETGRSKVPPALWRKIADVLGVEYGSLFSAEPAYPLPTPSSEPEPVLAPTVVAAGTCLEGDNCPRWHCIRCGVFWIGTAVHVCRFLAVRAS